MQQLPIVNLGLDNDSPTMIMEATVKSKWLSKDVHPSTTRGRAAPSVKNLVRIFYIYEKLRILRFHKDSSLSYRPGNICVTMSAGDDGRLLLAATAGAEGTEAAQNGDQQEQECRQGCQDARQYGCLFRCQPRQAAARRGGHWLFFYCMHESW